MNTPQGQQELLPMKDVTPKKNAAEPAKTKEKVAPKAAAAPPPASPPAKTKKKAGTAVAVHKPQAPAQQKNVLQIIADVASRPDANPTVMRELLDMQKEIMADQAKRDFNAAFIALQAEIPTIRRDGRIEVREKDPRTGSREHGRVQQSTPYATFNAIMTTIKPLLVKHGFALSFETEPMGERLLVKGRLEGYGHERTTAFPLPAETSGSKNNVQGWGSSMSYGKRYCTIALLNIVSEAPEDRDTDGEPNRESLKAAKGGGFVDVPDRPLVSEEQVVKLIENIEWCGVPKATFCKHYGIEKVSDLPADLFDAALKDCKDFHDNRQAKAKHG
jgi:hypothetical protein